MTLIARHVPEASVDEIIAELDRQATAQQAEADALRRYVDDRGGTRWN